MKTPIYNVDRATMMKWRRQGKKVVSHGSYRAKRKPNSPRVATGG